MFLSNKHKLLFIHIPKSGGTSIATGLYTGSGDIVFRSALGGSKHRTIWELKKYMKATGNDWFNLNDYYKVAFVRNPWERMLSFYFYLQQNEKDAPAVKGIKTFKDWIKSIDIKNPKKNHKHAFRPQLDFITDPSGKVLVNYIGRYEKIQKGFDVVKNQVGLTEAQLPHKNKSNHDHYSLYYDDECREKVTKMFKKDIEFFKYEYVTKKVK